MVLLFFSPTIGFTSSQFPTYEKRQLRLISFQFIQAFSFELIQAYFELIQDHFEYIQGLLTSFRLVQAHYGFQLIQIHLDCFEVIQAHLSSFRLIQTPLTCLSLFERFYTYLIYTHFNNQIYSRRNRFNLHFTYSLQVICCLQFTKKVQMCQYLFHDYHLAYILTTV